ncbi:hypothetical protein [Parasphingorhabdus cellanae]|uniref:Tyr recombinase domain-containing protein n=1 Tax=Parasphingorhabdus cellanae TaxID=2806553 RepID=A0ABX7T7H0_9SPHN|nr:hypothetical protein J4G78_07975 [Parasphingorhabdus cellanae]
MRHSFASVAAELGYSELTIASLLGHASRGVTQRYVHIDKAVLQAAEHVSAQLAEWLEPRRPSGFQPIGLESRQKWSSDWVSTKAATNR